LVKRVSTVRGWLDREACPWRSFSNTGWIFVLFAGRFLRPGRMTVIPQPGFDVAALDEWVGDRLPQLGIEEAAGS
jgi:hypothetical protein